MGDVAVRLAVAACAPDQHRQSVPGTAVSTAIFKFSVIEATDEHAFWKHENYEINGSIGLHYTSLDAKLKAGASSRVVPCRRPRQLRECRRAAARHRPAQHVEPVARFLARRDGPLDWTCSGPIIYHSVAFYMQLTIFSNVTNDMTIAREEIFGPVLCILPYDIEDEVIRIANDTRYGLSSYLFGAAHG